MSRLRLVSVLAALVAAIALTACGEGGGGGGDPRSTIDSATLRGIDSGKLDLSLAVDVPGREGGDFQLQLSGPFQGGEGGDLPRLDLDATAKGSAGGERLDFEGGIVLLTDSAYVNYKGVEYEVDQTSFSIIEPILNPRAGAGQGESEASIGCQEAVGDLRVSSFVDRLAGGEGVDVEGTDTTKVSGDLDVAGALDAILGLADDPACKSQLSTAGELPSRGEVEAAQEEVEEGLKRAHVDVYVGEDDIVRRIAAQLEIEPPQRSGGGPGRANVDFDLTLSEVNEEQEISAPKNAKPLNDLFLKLGVNPLELLGLLEGGGLAELIEEVGSAATDAGSGRADQRRYLKCLGEASTPLDLQKCTRLSR